VIRARGVACDYGPIRALDGADIRCTAGQLTGLIGPNGSGKSTLLHCLAGLQRPLQGEIFIDGRPLAAYHRQELARTVAVVFQENFFPFDFTAREIVLMGRSPHLRPLQDEGPQDRGIAEESMRMCDCLDLAGRSITALSGGERQRVVLARALAQRPRALLLDEPTNHLDLRHQRLVLELLRRLTRDHSLAVLTVLHDLNLASHYCDSIALLDRGRTVGQGGPAEVLDGARLSAVYQTEVVVSQHPNTGRPQILS
jgi:iron complex transport system ATP-binding protein